MGAERSVTVSWTGQGKVFEGRTGTAAPMFIDGDSQEGPSPTEALLMALAACMAIDVNVILQKGRVPLEDLTVDVSGVRAPDPPQRFLSLRIVVKAEGPREEDRPKLERAVQLSRDRYCSVFHTLRTDLEVEISTMTG
jgi:putative redox protein